MADTRAITVELDRHVATVKFHRPPQNYFDIALMAELAETLDNVADDPECRAVVLCAEGRHFCAGADLSDRDTVGGFSSLYASAVRMTAVPVPVVAAVQGAAVGGGLGLALAADFRVATPATRFWCNFSRLGFHHGFGLTVTLPALVGQQRARELMFTGRPVKGEEALAIGLVDRVVAADGLLRAAHAFAAEIAAAGPLALRAIVQTMRGDLPERIVAATAREAEMQEALSRTEDFAEGVRAMAERREPDFHGS